MTLEDLEPAGLFVAILMYEHFRRWWLPLLLKEKPWSERPMTLHVEAYFQAVIGACALMMAWASSDKVILSLLFIVLAALRFWDAWNCWRLYRSF